MKRLLIALIISITVFMSGCEITTSPEKEEDKGNISAVEIKPDSLFIGDSELMLFSGGKKALSVLSSPSDAVFSVEWLTSDERVAYVDNKGEVTAGIPGKAVISVKSDNGIETYLDVFVFEKPILRLDCGIISLGESENSINTLGLDFEFKGESIFSGETLIYTDQSGAVTAFFVLNGTIYGFYTEANAFSLLGTASGRVVGDFSDLTAGNPLSCYNSENEMYTFKAYTDSTDGDRIYAVIVFLNLLKRENVTITEAITKAYDNTMLLLTNSLRHRNGLAPLLTDNTLTECAKAHSTDMAVNNYADHTTPDGVTIGQRVTEAGIEWKYCGENIAGGFPLPYDACNGLYNSPSHRKNITDESYEYIGSGTFFREDSDYGFYSTQNFVLKNN